MDLYCTRLGCSKPSNSFSDLDDPVTLKNVEQKYCLFCGMPLILLGRYLPSKLLGQGGFGAAFLARDRYTPGMRHCVVKQFQPSMNLNPTQLQIAHELFEREAEALENMGNAHPQIPDLYAFFELAVPAWQPGYQNRFFYLVQEFIDGLTMEEELAQQGPFSTESLLEMMREILTILDFVHTRGAIHRDIKPSNIMRHRNGRIYLLDFGAVRQVTKGNPKSTGIYSEGFAPPEQMAGGEIYPSSDLYALAVTCLLLLTGKPPNELYEAYSNSWRWRDDVPNLPPVVADVLDRMLKATPKERFQSATEVLQALASLPVPVSSLSPAAASSSQHLSTASSKPFPPTIAPVHPVASPVSHLSKRTVIEPFSMPDLLSSAGLIGFEAGLLAIALVSLLGTTLVSAGFWLILLAGLVFAQSRRVIQQTDVLILAGLSFALIAFIPSLRQVIAPIANNSVMTLAVIAMAVGCFAIAVMILLRLLYLVLSKFL